MGHSEEETVAELTELLTRASWRLRKNERKELRPFGLSFGQARALRLLAEAPSPMRIGDLAGRLEIVPRSATTVVDRLEEAGLVTRAMGHEDRRSILVVPTANGKALVSRLKEDRRAGAENLFAPLSPGEKSELQRLLSIVATETAET